MDYIILRNSSFKSSTDASFGLPGAQASACADSARKSRSDSLIASSFDGIPTSSESFPDCCNSGFPVLFLGHGIHTFYAHRPCNFTVLLRPCSLHYTPSQSEASSHITHRAAYHKPHLMYVPWSGQFQDRHWKIPYLRYTVRVLYPRALPACLPPRRAKILK